MWLGATVSCLRLLGQRAQAAGVASVLAAVEEHCFRCLRLTDSAHNRSAVSEEAPITPASLNDHTCPRVPRKLPKKTPL